MFKMRGLLRLKRLSRWCCGEGGEGGGVLKRMTDKNVDKMDHYGKR